MPRFEAGHCAPKIAAVVQPQMCVERARPTSLRKFRVCRSCSELAVCLSANIEEQ